jgi:hypothetical protein
LKKVFSCIGFIAVLLLNASGQTGIIFKITKVSLPMFVQRNKPVTLSGAIHNYSSEPITSLQLNYSINNGTTVSDVVNSLIIAPQTEYHFIHSQSWIPAHNGIYVIKIWADMINGNKGTGSLQDTLVLSPQSVDSVAVKEPLFEDFSQASCHNCFLTGPNIDSVFTKNNGICNLIDYHTNFPGLDFMNDVTNKPFENTRMVYYNVNNVPNGQLDGTKTTNNVSPDTLSSAFIQKEVALGSPFVISANATYNLATNTYSLNAIVKSYINTFSTMKLRLRGVLTIDTLKYNQDQSTEDPVSAFQPPLGTTPATKGGDADSAFKYVLVYHSVAEDMLPDSLGQKLQPFTAGSSQSFNFNWKKNHTWGFCPQGNCIDNGTGLGSNTGTKSIYDSVNNAVHIVLFVQSDSSLYVYQSASIVPSVVSGIAEVSEEQNINIYPNPANGKVNVAFSLKELQNLTIEVFNVVGQKVYENCFGKLSAGQHNIAIDTKNFVSGLYLVKLTTTTGSVTKKIAVQ